MKLILLYHPLSYECTTELKFIPYQNIKFFRIESWQNFPVKQHWKGQLHPADKTKISEAPEFLSFSKASVPLPSSLAVNMTITPWDASCLHICHPGIGVIWFMETRPQWASYRSVETSDCKQANWGWIVTIPLCGSVANKLFHFNSNG